MRIAAALAAVLGGALLLAVPRFVFPTCEQLGRGRMHCTDAARAEYVAGALLLGAGAGLFALRQRGAAMALTALAAAVCVAAVVAPGITRYCANPDMPCHYGMVPSVRFIGSAVGLVQVAALVSLARRGTGGGS
ncbi:MAG TPA: DUF4418 family protein [bacterium]